jgi:hypothetical protein
MRRPIHLIPALLAFCAACGHADATPSQPASVALQKSSFADLFSLARTIELEQPDTAPIVRLSGIDRAEDGRLLVGDVSEGNVKLFAPDGRLLAIIGRKGEGPGEFSAPRYPRFGPDGLIYVADAQNPRVQVFDAAGKLLRGTRVDGFSGVAGFEPLPNGNYLLAVHRESDPRVLAELDTTGRVIRELLPIGNVRPAGQPDNPLWRNVSGVFLDVSGDTAYVSNTLADSLWTVHLPSGQVRRTHLAFSEEYVRPTVPRDAPRDLNGLMAWSNSFHTASVVTAAGGTLVVPFVQGVLNNGDPLLLTVRDASGRWRVVSDAPPVIGGSRNQVIAILNPGEDQVRLGLFSRTPAR